MRIIRFLLGIALIPVCFAISLVVISIVQMITPSSPGEMSAPGWALIAGFGLWILLYVALPLPVRTYVLAHELTHALWGAMMGARVFNLRVSKTSGSVTLSKSNFLITLAPYFFPLYTIIVIIAYYVLSIFVDTNDYYLLWLGLVGFTWGFHFTFTISTLLQHQSDIKECGHVFSYAVIYLLNALGICLWVVIVSDATLEQMIHITAVKMAGTASVLWKWTLLVAAEIRQ